MHLKHITMLLAIHVPKSQRPALCDKYISAGNTAL